MRRGIQGGRGSEERLDVRGGTWRRSGSKGMRETMERWE